LVDGHAGLADERRRRDGNPSRIEEWPGEGDLVPIGYLPARNELLLEKPSNYPGEYTRLGTAQVDERDYGNALARARREVITGISDKGAKDQVLIRTITRWVPRDARLRLDLTPTTAAFDTAFDLDDLRSRARIWLRKPDTPVARYLGQTLEDYLGAA